MKCKLHKSVNFIFKIALFLTLRTLQDSTKPSYSLPTLSKIPRKKTEKFTHEGIIS